MSDKSKTLILSGKSLAPGLGRGRTVVYRDVLTRFDEFYEIEEAQIDEEMKRFEQAIEAISADLRTLTGRVEQEMSADLSDIFEAHIAMAQDASLHDEVKREIKNELVSAGSAVRSDC